MSVEVILQVGVFALGSIVGSFLNVCIVRLPRGASIVSPGSHCPACGQDIPWYWNVPLVSYLLLRGRCRYCREPIPARYLVVEVLTGAVAVLLCAVFGPGAVFAAGLAFSAALIVITFIDLDHRIIPDVISLPGIVLCFVCSFFVPWTTPLDAVLGIAAGGGILWGCALGYWALTGKEGMGGGDIKLLAMIGAFLGWQKALAALMLASLGGSLVGLVLIAFSGRSARDAVPFGPFLALGAFAALLCGDRLIHWYMTLGPR